MLILFMVYLCGSGVYQHHHNPYSSGSAPQGAGQKKPLLGGDGHDLCHMGMFKEFQMKHGKFYDSPQGKDTAGRKIHRDIKALVGTY